MPLFTPDYSHSIGRHNDAHIVLFYRNFMAQKGTAYKHIGLGVSAMHTVKVLRRHDISADVHGIWIVDHIREYLKTNLHVTHALIEAPFIGHEEMAALCSDFPRTQFICRVHSQIGFLQVEAGAVKLIREYLRLQDTSLNFTLAGNSTRFTKFIEVAYRTHCLHLPNLYDDDRPVFKHERRRNPNPLKVSSFGAIRLLKNHSTSAAAGLILARKRNVDLEFYMNVEREEHGQGVLQAIRNMFAGLSWARLIEVPWSSWSDFRQTVATMDLALQVSSSETFNLTSADVSCENVPSVVSHAIEWMPWWFKANTDDAAQIARVGNRLLNIPWSGWSARRALHRYGERSIKVWQAYLA